MKKLFILLVCIPFISWSQQQLKGTFSPAEDFTYAFLYKASPNGADYVTRAKLDSIGSFTIDLDATLAPGIYKIVYAIPPEDNNFDFIYNGKEDVVLNFSPEQGVTFESSIENKLWHSYQKSMDMINQTISNYYRKESTDQTAFNAIFKTLKDTQNAYETSAEGTLAKTFITSNKPYIPKGYEDISTYSNNLKTHYLKPVDFNNELLQSSTFIDDRIITYVFGLNVESDNEGYKKHIDNVVIALNSVDLSMQSQLLYVLWKNFSNSGNETVANYISDLYLMDMAKQLNSIELIQTLSAYKNTTIGATAIDFEIPSPQDKGAKTMLSDLKGSDYYILIFWSSTCGHCLKELPKVKELTSSMPNVKVIAYGIEDSEGNWKKEISSYSDFIHVLGLDKWNNPLIKQYGISATPTYFILDKHKKIIAKPYELKDLQTALDQL